MLYYLSFPGEVLRKISLVLTVKLPGFYIIALSWTQPGIYMLSFKQIFLKQI